MSKIFRFFTSIRFRLTLWYSLILLTTLVAFGLITYDYVRQQLSDNLDRSLKYEVQWVQSYIEPKVSKVKPSKKFRSKAKLPEQSQIPQVNDSSFVQSDTEMTQADNEIWNQIYEHALFNPKKTLIEVTNKWGAIVFRTYSVGDEVLDVGDVPLQTIKIQSLKTEKGLDLRVAATATENLQIYVAYPLDEFNEMLGNLFSIFLILIPIALAVSLIGGWFLAFISLRPVDIVTKTAREITAHNLDKQIPRRGVDDELGRLISTFNEMIARLRHSFDQVKQFSVDASHELRTPLTIMRGEVELALRNPKSSEEYRRVLVSNMEEIVRLTSIIENLLTLSKGDMKSPELQFEKIQMQEIVQELYEDSEIIAAKKHVVIDLTKNENVTLVGDRVRLRQLFLNLVDNAIKYTPEDGRVTLSSQRQNGWITVKVQDTGIGIPKEEQSKIFDRFYRADMGRSREFGGSGLGLSIAKWIAELHRGRIEVESEPGKGSTFTVYFPA
jgi:two-component system OmpR family sensor kinase